MATEPKTITVRPGSELYALLEQADGTPLLLERAGVRYRLDRTGGGSDAASRRDAGSGCVGGRCRATDGRHLQDRSPPALR